MITSITKAWKQISFGLKKREEKVDRSALSEDTAAQEKTDSYYEFITKSGNALADSIGIGKHVGWAKTVDDVADFLADKIGDSVMNEEYSESSRKKNESMISVLTHELENGNVVITSREEMLLFMMIVMTFWDTHYVVEHYAQNGELMEPMTLLHRKGYSIYDIQERMSLLYAYEMSSADHRELPLEILMEFSGFSNEGQLVTTT